MMQIILSLTKKLSIYISCNCINLDLSAMSTLFFESAMVAKLYEERKHTGSWTQITKVRKMNLQVK